MRRLIFDWTEYQQRNELLLLRFAHYVIFIANDTTGQRTSATVPAPTFVSRKKYKKTEFLFIFFCEQNRLFGYTRSDHFQKISNEKFLRSCLRQKRQNMRIKTESEKRKIVVNGEWIICTEKWVREMIVGEMNTCIAIPIFCSKLFWLNIFLLKITRARTYDFVLFDLSHLPQQENHFSPLRFAHAP